jgi:uncharacterized protein YndB with AHSA1/START domain
MNPTIDINPIADIDIEYDFSQPPEQVWRVLTEPALLAAWLLPNDAQSADERPIQMGRQFSLQAGADETIACEVLELEPHRLLRCSWRVEKSDEAAIDTVVTFVLNETADGGTHLRLVHSGFPAQPQRVVASNVISLPRRKVQGITSMLGAQLKWAA